MRDSNGDKNNERYFLMFQKLGFNHIRLLEHPQRHISKYALCGPIYSEPATIEARVLFRRNVIKQDFLANPIKCIDHTG